MVHGVFSRAELEDFARHGYVRLDQAFPPASALAMQEEIWAELREGLGIDRSDPATWCPPRKSPKRAKTSPRNEEVASPRFRAAIDQLLGPGSWAEPGNWGGFLITFPTPREPSWTVPTETWHWDYGLRDGDGLGGLLIFTFFSEVEARGGGTLLLAGSHRLLWRFWQGLGPEERALGHSKLRKRFLDWDPWLAALAGRGPGPEDRTEAFMGSDTEVAGCQTRVVELVGAPGDAVFCHPWMLHAPAGQNHSDRPRFMRAKFLW